MLGYNAFHRGELIAHYSTIPIKVNFFGHQRSFLLSLNTATDPRHHKRGLFKKLAQLTYELGKENGFDAVIAVANANSLPGFTNHLGFEFVSQLDAKIGILHPALSSLDKIQNSI